MNIKLLLLILVTVISVKSYPQLKNDSLNHLLLISSGTDKVNLLNDLAYAYSLEQTEFALECATEAAELSDTLNYDLGRGYASQNLGFISYLNGEFGPATQGQEVALQIASTTEDIVLKKRAYETLGLIQEESGSPEKSLQYYHMAYDQGRLLNDPVGMGISLMGAGRAYEKMNRHSQALQNNLQVQSLFLKLGNDVGIAKNCIILANNHLALENPDSAFFYLNMAEEIITDMDYHELLLDLYLEKISFYFETRLDSSLFYAEKAIILSGDLVRPYLKRDLLLQASDMYSKRGEFQLSYDFHQRYTQLNDSLIHLQQQVIPNRHDLMLNDAIYSGQDSAANILDSFGQAESVSFGRLLTGFGVLVLCISGLMVWMAIRYRTQKKSLEKLNILQAELAKLTSDLANKDKTILDLRMARKDPVRNEDMVVMADGPSSISDKIKAEEEIKNDLLQNAHELFIAEEWEKLKNIRQALSISGPDYRLPDDEDERQGHLNLEKMTSSLINLKSRKLAERITFHHAGNPVTNMYCHPGSILLLVSILMQNAIEAIDEKGDIFIDYHAREEMIIYRIMDNGKGIADEDLHQIFEPFFSTKKSNHHLGLGLSLGREIVRAHNAVIKVNSKTGTGTEIILEFYYS